QVWRHAQRLNETSMWSFWGKNEAGGPALFGHVEGLRIAQRPRGFEVLPYTVARASYVAPSQPGSPFQDTRDYSVRAGADVKALLGSSLTLSATLNPDFGQVEVDPAVVNLSAFETFFEERRPFFVEGSGLFSFGGLSCFTCSNVSGMSLFYSRRIGRRPQGAVPGDPLYWDVPESTGILGAAKLTGRFRSGWEVGVLNAVTAPERVALVYGEGEPRLEREVEPLTNYLVGRVRRTMRGGDLIVGGMATSVARRFGYDSLARQIPEHAEAAGVDWTWSWAKRAYEMRGNFAVSQVSGEPAAIQRLQESSARYFQRPDRGHGSNGVFSDRYDPTLASLRGYGGYLRVAKQAGLWLWETQVNYRSPGFEVNDLAFLSRADYVWMHGNLRRRWTAPTPYYRYFQVTAGAQREQNFDGDVVDGQVHLSTYAQLPNYWETSLYMHARPEMSADRYTRGGPVVRRAPELYVSPSLSTDPRGAVVLSSNPWVNWNTDGSRSYRVNADLRLKPTSSVAVSLGPAFTHNESDAQFVRRWDDPSATHFMGQRAVFSRLEQNTLSLDTRLNVTFTPTLTLELFAQPFVSGGEYSAFREYDAPRSLRRTPYDAAQLRAVRDASGRDSVYLLDPDRDGTAEFSFRNPDFNLRSLRGNAVLRWEYRPGSTLFLVWQQNRSGGEPFGDFRLGRDAAGVFRPHPDNVFVLKATYWIGR
ncbi:MAG TPA: DUF5916 domain-containing protein, partial [Longimicrobiaceae bacterium]|nr:DUF5916 domain-containing protein [Longimicrobiaceae bacterium]